MKRLIILVVSVLLYFSTAMAQSSGREALVQQAEQLITSFQLNDSVAQLFKKTYYSYARDMRAIQMEYTHVRPADDQVLTDDEIEERILDNFAMSRSILNLREQYYHKFRQILSPSQINAIFEGEKARRAQLKK